MSNFITNSPTKDLKKRINEIIRVSEELKFLVGFFYFSGLRELYEALKDNSDVVLKVLVGLDVDKLNKALVEYAFNELNNDDEKIELFLNSLRKSINTEQFDTAEFYTQANFFLQMLIDNRLIIRKTYQPNHSKLYLFKLDANQVIKSKLFITGSSNLTKAGLSTQHEFNVEISDYGFEEAEKYFDQLWNDAVKITELEDIKTKLIKILEEETHIKKLTPFEAYLLILKSYLDTFEHKDIGTYLPEFLEKIGYKRYQYQLDAVKLALSIIEQHNGVLIADVVGLGKTVIACAIAKALKKRGMVLCPPGLVGDDNKSEGWKKYLDQFELYDWEARSIGKLEETFQYIKNREDFEVIIVDEAHRFRNQDTQSYELLKNICRGRIVILLTATPFNNRPSDILALLNLFIIPRKSSITLNNDLISQFRTMGFLFEKLSYIKKYYQSNDADKRDQCRTHYKLIFNEDVIDIRKVSQKTHLIAQKIRDIIEPITIRRNRIDLQKNPNYRNEVKELSVVADPIEWFFELSQEQSIFYDKIIKYYFANPDDGGKFKGAIYRPSEYETGLNANSDVKDQKKQRELLQQRNLYDIMRRLVVKRFESSFGAFEKTIQRFIEINETVLKFIKKTGNDDLYDGEYILDRSLLENIVERDLEEIEKHLNEYEKQIKDGVYPKQHKRYKISQFKEKESFINDIKADIAMFNEVLKQLRAVKLVEQDPKTKCLIEHLIEEINKPALKHEPKRKIIIFSEYADTVEYLYKNIEEIQPQLARRTMVVKGHVTQSKYSEIIHNFDASATNQRNDFDLLLSTDKLSEGFNLNRAGMIINYDIPWNPVRVIQRLGRINRISRKVFDQLYIVNFFPTIQGAELVKSREIAQQKMYMIHNTLGEDAKIFDIDEEPSAALLYQKIMQNPENAEKESFYTKILNTFIDLKNRYPQSFENIKDAPARIKVTKASNEDNMIVCFKKDRMYIRMGQVVDGKLQIDDTSLELVLDKLQCTPEIPALPIDNDFWQMYGEIKQLVQKQTYATTEQSIEQTALNKLNYLIQLQAPELLPYKPFLRTLKEDIIDYGTLSQYTLRRIADLTNNGNNLNKAIEEIQKLMDDLGENYLEKEKQKISSKNTEIIVAVRNKIFTPS
ncbi:MAG TPA: helicase-related protein [Bacteroidales bacterium]|nr:helicase-related protein [Bacteroidales bacterium]